MPPVDLRAELERVMRATLADEAAAHDWTYQAVRPMPVPTSWKAGQHVRADCSKGVQFLARWAGAPDPMKNDFSDWGNSTTLTVVLPHLSSPGELRVGDVVTFGPDGNDHAAMVLEAGADPLLWSHGHPGAPNAYRLSQDGREKHFLRLNVPDVPPDVAKLRAETGFYAWTAWRLGEGDWRRYGKAAKGVRPNVPRAIPASWWARYLRFLKNRKRPNAATLPA
jgi:hypothetical protein